MQIEGDELIESDGKVALLTGVTGRDGAYLSEVLLATGVTTRVRDFVSHAFAQTGVTIAWEGEGVDEIGRDAATGTVRVEVDPRYFRPAKVDLLVGDPSKAKARLGWVHKTGWQALCEEIVQEDLIRVEKGRRGQGD